MFVESFEFFVGVNIISFIWLCIIFGSFFIGYQIGYWSGREDEVEKQMEEEGI